MGAIVVAVVTTAAVGYFASRQDDVFDTVDDAMGSDPILVHPGHVDSVIAGNPWVLPAPLSPDRAAHVADPQEFAELISASDAAPLGTSETPFTFEGNRHESVIIEQIKARVVQRSDPPAGTLISQWPGGGPSPKIIFGFNLDEVDPHARIVNQDGTLGEIFDTKSYFEIHRGEKYVFLFYGTATGAQTYKWVIDLVLQIGDQRQTMTLGTDTPFVVAGPADTYTRYYERGANISSLAPVSAKQLCPEGCVARADDWVLIR